MNIFVKLNIYVAPPQSGRSQYNPEVTNETVTLICLDRARSSRNTRKQDIPQ